MASIAIDGPAGAGKSTIAKMIAKKLEFIYIDTGAMYRAIALECIKKGVEMKSEPDVVNACKNAEILIKYIEGTQHVILNGDDVTESVRTEEAGIGASAVSVYKEVREKLVEMQRKLAKTSNVVMDGRDIGTVVLPEADLKIFLTASVEERARRRVNELNNKGIDSDINVIKEDIAMRDERDMTRKESPLCKADDAVTVDSSDMNIDEVVSCIINLYNKTGKEVR